jgi:hypothetical protein
MRVRLLSIGRDHHLLPTATKRKPIQDPQLAPCWLKEAVAIALHHGTKSDRLVGHEIRNLDQLDAFDDSLVLIV